MKLPLIAVVIALSAFVSMGNSSCEQSPMSSSGITSKSVQVQTDQNGWTVEQKNIAERYRLDNKPGAIKHLYVISPYSGQAIIYSTVKGKVTSSGKRLAPRMLTGSDRASQTDFMTSVGRTAEVLEDDGTYGNSVEYIYWWDAKGVYHQHFFTGGQIIHVSDQPLPVHSVTINLSGVTE